jgi:hypothetical protein
MALRIIITGGTFDKHYDELKGVLAFKDSHLPDIIRQVRITEPVELEINQLVDSLEMGEEGARASWRPAPGPRKTGSSSPTGPTAWWRPPGCLGRQRWTRPSC